MNQRLHITFAGGVTGGHLFPGLAVAEEIARRAPGCHIRFSGSGREWERKTVGAAGYDYTVLPAAPLVASPMGVIRALYTNSVGYRAARRSIQSQRPDVVVGLGGYSSVPLGLAAAREGVPLVLLEQNIIPGRANRLLARWASTLCLAFEESADYFSMRPRLEVTGNPVRSSIVTRALVRSAEANQHRDSDPLLVILGGSQGAHSINQHVASALPQIAHSLSNWKIVHQTGIKDVDGLRASYELSGMHVTVIPFITDVGDVLSRATLVIARAGATTLAELAITGIPAILLPYPFATSNHQWYNAQAFGRAGAAVIVNDRAEPDRTAQALVSALLPLIRLPELRREMRLAMLRLARPDAAAAVVSALFAPISQRALECRSA